MKVGHIWNICGIGGLLSRYLDREFPEKYESIAIDRGFADKYGHNNEKTLVWNNRAMIWLARCFFYARKLDIIHVHSGIQWLKYYRFLYPKKIIIVHVHGTKVRENWQPWEKDLKNADQIIVSTPDLLKGAPEGTRYLPNPVDEKLILEIKEECKGLDLIKAAFHMECGAILEAKDYADRYGLDLVCFNRFASSPLCHKNFLLYMYQFQYYIDVKRDYPGGIIGKNVLEAASLTGLEAMGLGMKVIDWKGDLVSWREDIHGSTAIAKELNQIYSTVIKRKIRAILRKVSN
jgi:hypothetical protein